MLSALDNRAPAEGPRTLEASLFGIEVHQSANSISMAPDDLLGVKYLCAVKGILMCHKR
jgi:hypothetical protein